MSVLSQTGHVYERRHIKKWFAHGNHTCPMTGVKLSNLKLTASHAFRNTINDFMTKLFQVRQLLLIIIRLQSNYLMCSIIMFILLETYAMLSSHTC